VTKWATVVQHPTSLLRVLRRAFKVAGTAPMGPVYVCLPQDVLDGGVVRHVHAQQVAGQRLDELAVADDDTLRVVDALSVPEGVCEGVGAAEIDAVTVVEGVGVGVAPVLCVVEPVPLSEPVALALAPGWAQRSLRKAMTAALPSATTCGRTPRCGLPATSSVRRRGRSATSGGMAAMALFSTLLTKQSSRYPRNGRSRLD
jgi:thiamine pyrophosphate-dependent acetolactate synthase large subunit-like protein